MSLTLERCTALYGDPNVRAFLRVIREGESGQTDDAYTIINGGAHFTPPPWRHPHQGVPTTQGGRAAGAYQFLGTTWRNVAQALELGEDFSPINQDIGAVYLIDGRGAIAAVQAGDLVLACRKLAQEWVSLPGLGLDRAQRIFVSYGGKLAGQIDAGAAPAEPERPIPQIQPYPPQTPDLGRFLPIGGSMGAAAIFLPMIMQLVPQLFKVPGLTKVVNAVPTVGAAGGSPHAADYLPLVQAVVDAFTQAVPGAVNTQQAVEMAQASPKVAAAAAQAVLAAPDIVEELNKLAPVLDRIHKYEQDSWTAEEESRNAAADRAIAQQREGPLSNNPTFLLALLVMALVCTVVVAVLFKGGFSTDMQAFVIGAVVGSALTAVLSFYFGSSRGSAAKDATIDRLATTGGR